MRDFRIGSIHGFEIRIDYSWFIIFFLILWSFSFIAFPANFPHLSRAAYLGMGLIGTLLFFASLLAHEFSHSVVARAKGIPVEGITLFIFGGMSRTRMEAETPGDEFQVAGVGPLTSLALGVLFWFIAWLGTRGGWSIAVIGVAEYLAFLNIILAVFNLLPGFPLDGGRLFRAIVWKITGDVTKATHWAAIGGNVLGWILIALGVLQLIQGVLLGGIWLVFIGWFLRNAATMSYQQHLLTGVLEGVQAEEAMTRDPETVRPDLTLQHLVDDYFMRRRHEAFPVTEDDRPLGLITLQQVKDVPREDWDRRTVRETMTPTDDGAVVVGPEEQMDRVLEKLEGASAPLVLVARDDRLEGVITPADLASWLARVRELGGRRQGGAGPAGPH